jgi:hypothetical protein
MPSFGSLAPEDGTDMLFRNVLKDVLTRKSVVPIYYAAEA